MKPSSNSLTAVVIFFATLAILWPEASDVFAADGGPLQIQPSEPRVQIRAEILKATPPGTKPQAVLDYIRKTLEPKSEAPAPTLRNEPARGSSAENSGKAGVHSVRLVLGQYLRNPATFLMEIPIVTKTTTTVQWAFDKDGKLLEVFVDKDSELGDSR